MITKREVLRLNSLQQRSKCSHLAYITRVSAKYYARIIGVLYVKEVKCVVRRTVISNKYSYRDAALPQNGVYLLPKCVFADGRNCVKGWQQYINSGGDDAGRQGVAHLLAVYAHFAKGREFTLPKLQSIPPSMQQTQPQIMVCHFPQLGPSVATLSQQ